MGIGAVVVLFLRWSRNQRTRARVIIILSIIIIMSGEKMVERALRWCSVRVSCCWQSIANYASDDERKGQESATDDRIARL